MCLRLITWKRILRIKKAHNLEEELAHEAVGRGQDQLALLPRLPSRSQLENNYLAEM